VYRRSQGTAGIELARHLAMFRSLNVAATGMVTVPSNATFVTIAVDGTVSVLQPGSATPNNLGQITLTTFPNPTGLQSEGHKVVRARLVARDEAVSVEAPR
jgi:flagellar basal body rod protein FlgG